MARIGYARVSTKDQNLDLQLSELEKSGCEKVYSEHKSGLKARLELAYIFRSIPVQFPMANSVAE